MSQTPKKEAPQMEIPQSAPPRKKCRLNDQSGQYKQGAAVAQKRRTMDVRSRKTLFEPRATPIETLDGTRSIKRRISRALSVSPPGSPVHSLFSSNNGSEPTQPKTRGDEMKPNETKIIPKYQARRALSQLDLKKAGHFTKNDFVRISLLMNDNKDAAVRVYNRVISISFRKRFAELKHLKDELANEKQVNIKERNHLHALKTLFYEEQSRTAVLKHQLKNSNAALHALNMNCVKLTTSIIEAKSDKSVLEQQLEMTEDIIAKLTDQLSQVKFELSKTLNHAKELRTELTANEVAYKTLLEEEENLMCEIQDLNKKMAQQQQLQETSIEAEKEAFLEICEKANIVKKTIAEQELKQKVNMATEMKLLKEKEALSAEIEALQSYLDRTIDKRMKVCYKNTVRFKDTALELMHWAIVYLLPAVPPPKSKAPKLDLSIGMNLNKALTYLKR